MGSSASLDMDMPITISVPKPDGMPRFHELSEISREFQESGVKEEFALDVAHWPEFVEKEQARLRKVLNAADDDEHKRHFIGIIDSMKLWALLERYGGDHISMANVKSGNTMRIFALGFRKKENVIVYKCINYSKTVMVHRSEPIEESSTLFGRVCLKLSTLGIARTDKQINAMQKHKEEKWAQLLQREDVAKYLLALTFKDALAKDGVILAIGK